MLLERLGPSLGDLGLPLPEVLDVIADTLRSFWRPVDSTGLCTGPEKPTWLAAYIVRTWEELARPCELTVIRRIPDAPAML